MMWQTAKLACIGQTSPTRIMHAFLCRPLLHPKKKQVTRWSMNWCSAYNTWHVWAGSFLAINLLWAKCRRQWPNITNLSSPLVMVSHNFCSHPFNVLCYILPFLSNRSYFISCKHWWYSLYPHNCIVPHTDTKKKSHCIMRN